MRPAPPAQSLAASFAQLKPADLVVTGLGAVPLAEFVPSVTPRYTAPRHLVAYTRLLERTHTQRVRAVVSTPPRHGKSETTLHFIVQCLLRDPSDTIAYVTYGQRFSEQQGQKALRIADRAGLRLSTRRQDYWETPEGGSVDWNSIGGQLTGKGFKKLIVDDPVKDREEAESALLREKAWDWFNDVALSRVEPDGGGGAGGSAVIIQTRWHPDDLAGRAIGAGWERVNLKAIDDDGRALWPERWPVEVLEEHRAQPYKWASLYQGEPRPKGGRVFGDPHWTLLQHVPNHGIRISLGADFAYSSKTYADYSVTVALVARAEHDIQRGNITRYYVADVQRQQVEAPAFRATIARQRESWRGNVTAYIAGTEKGVVDFLKQEGIPLLPLPATVDKFSRAQPVAAAWNAGDVLVPKDAPWADAFVNELASFTGVGDRHDDQVDALAGAFAPFAGPPKRRTEQTNYAFG